ncbi:hypothetical protein [Marinoscillum pacificum]|uniref:hypothetical protein n=1 Tax=Marinoscillum pacificum TaxID=392723 RepID=UPI002157182B|nr:hypothetical protein [Marinoscillum pacificum]
MKGRIDQVRFGYKIVSKLQEDDDLLSTALGEYGMSWCRATTPFTKPVVFYWEANYKNEKLLKYMTFRELLRDYNVPVKLDEIRVGGVNMSDDDLNIPESIKKHWKYQYHESLSDLYVSDVLKECMDLDHMSLYQYEAQQVDEIQRKHDKLCYEFFKLGQNI